MGDESDYFHSSLLKSEFFDDCPRAPALAARPWVRRLAETVEGAGLALADVVLLVQPEWRVVQLLPEPVALYANDAPVEALEGALDGHARGALRVVHRVHPPVVEAMSRGELGLG